MTGTSSIVQRTALDLVKELRTRIAPTQREVGDIRRNAALFLAHRANCERSCFARDLPLSVDESRFSELPYVSALGYLLEVGALKQLPLLRLSAALDATTRRAPHTQERTGFADDVLCLCGLLLLSRFTGHGSLAEQLREHLTGMSHPDAAICAVVATTLAAPVRPTAAFNEDAPEHLAAALLLGRIDDGLCRKSFPALPADLEGHLLSATTEASFLPAADFGSMVVLAALEASIVLPNEERPSVDGRCDVGIVVALKEEFRVLFDRFENRHSHVEHRGRSYYLFDVPTVVGSEPCRCVATLVGDMGTNRTGVIAEKMFACWDPTVIAIVGIAGGIHEDVKLGDVIVASEVSNYFEGAKAATDGSGTEFRRSSDSFKTNHVLLERIRNFEFAHRSVFQRWRRACASRREELGDAAATLLRDGLLRDEPNEHEGHIASGPLVVASGPFVRWIRSGDRACLGVEMEAGGLMLSAHMTPEHRDALVIRAVSDFGDERKSKLDAVGGGALRRYAMENATDFLWALMQTGALGPARAGP